MGFDPAVLRELSPEFRSSWGSSTRGLPVSRETPSGRKGPPGTIPAAAASEKDIRFSGMAMDWIVAAAVAVLSGMPGEGAIACVAALVAMLATKSPCMDGFCTLVARCGRGTSTAAGAEGAGAAEGGSAFGWTVARSPPEAEADMDGAADWAVLAAGLAEAEETEEGAGAGADGVGVGADVEGAEAVVEVVSDCGGSCCWHGWACCEVEEG